MMEYRTEKMLIFCLLCNILVFSSTLGSVILIPLSGNTLNSDDFNGSNAVQVPVKEPIGNDIKSNRSSDIQEVKIPGNGSNTNNGDTNNKSNIQEIQIPLNNINGDDANNSSIAPNGIPQSSENKNSIENQATVSPDSGTNEIINAIMKMLPQIMNSVNNNTSVQIEPTDNSPNDNSVGITTTPATSDNATQTDAPAESTALVPVQSQQENTPAVATQEVTPVIDSQNASQPENDSNLDQKQSENEPESESNNENLSPTPGCGHIQIQDSQPKLQLNQVTVSQILYHLNVQYEKLYSKQGDVVKTYEVLKTFLRKMLRVSEEVTSDHNKNIVSITYAAYYSTEYAYTFTLCKLHHITGGPKNQQNTIDSNVSSHCSQIVETFKSFNAVYEKIVSEEIENKGNNFLRYDNENDKNENTNSEEDGSDISRPNTRKISTSNNEIIENQDLEKDLHGFNNNDFFSRVRSESSNLDRYDFKRNQEFGKSTYSEDTRGKQSNSAALLLSEVREIPKNKSPEDPSNGAMRLRKISNTIQTSNEAETQGHLINDEIETNSNRSQKYNRKEKKLDQYERNYLNEDNNDIGGNIEAAKLQDVEAHYTATIERVQDINEQVTTPRNHETKNTKYTFNEVVEKLLSYIRKLHAFTDSMETKVGNPKESTDNPAKDTYDEMYKSLYEETFTYRQYLSKYFSATNVENGTFNGKDDVDTKEQEAKTVQATIERFLWLRSTYLQGQSNSAAPSNAEDDMENNPVKLLWYFEEASFYLEHLNMTEKYVPFMSYLPYPSFGVTALPNADDGADIQFYLN